MNRNQRPPNEQPDGRPPRTILEVLCREVGAAHPDGALKQIRTMKRLLRSHYRNQQRLQRWGIDGLNEAVQRVQKLQAEVESLREAQRHRAAANVAAIDEAMSVIDTARQRLRERAAQSPASGDGAPEAAMMEVSAVMDLVNDVETELDELRLELWALSDEDDEPDAGSDSRALLDRLTSWLRALARENTALQAERDRLDTRHASLVERLQHQKIRINALSDRQIEGVSKS